MAFRLISLILSLSLFCQQAGIAYASGELNLANYLSQARSAIVQPDRFQPARLRYISYDINNNDFKLLLDKGDAKLNNATQELFNYFLIGLALPNDTFWVNLRPDAPENIIDPLLEKTDIGKIFLEADLQLKKDTASLTSPQNPEGRQYWDKLYKKAGELFGSENIAIPTITRPWIVPNEVIVRETEDSAYIYKATLKVMLEADYLQNQKTKKPKNPKTEEYGFSDPRLKELNEYSSRIIRETIIPRLTREVNSSKRYAKLKQVYYSLVLSRWFKQKYSSLGSIRAPERPSTTLGASQSTGASANSYLSLIDSGNLANLASPEPCDKQSYFQAYQKSFKDGEYNLKETVALPSGQSIRNYISGGINTRMQLSKVYVGVNSKKVTDVLKNVGMLSGSPIEIAFWDGETRKKGTLTYVRGDELGKDRSEKILNNKPFFMEDKTRSNLDVIEAIKGRNGELLSNIRFAFSDTGVLEGYIVISKEGNSIAAINSVAGVTQWIETALIIAVIQELADSSPPVYSVKLNNVLRDNPYQRIILRRLSGDNKKPLYDSLHINQQEKGSAAVYPNDIERLIKGYYDYILEEVKNENENHQIINKFSASPLELEEKDGERLRIIRNLSEVECLLINKQFWKGSLMETVNRIYEYYVEKTGKEFKRSAVSKATELKVRQWQENKEDLEKILAKVTVDELKKKIIKAVGKDTGDLGVNSDLAEVKSLDGLIDFLKKYSVELNGEVNSRVAANGKLKLDMSVLKKQRENSYPFDHGLEGKIKALENEISSNSDYSVKFLEADEIVKQFRREIPVIRELTGVSSSVVMRKKDWENWIGKVRGIINVTDKILSRDFKEEAGSMRSPGDVYAWLDEKLLQLQNRLKEERERLSAERHTVYSRANGDRVKYYEERISNLESVKQDIGKIPEPFKAVSSSVGGIDLTDRFMRLKIERVGSFSDLKLFLPQVQNAPGLDLDNEFKQIEAIASSGIVPNSRRILELFSACYSRGKFGQRLPQVISCLKASSAIQEKLAIDSDDDFRLCLLLPEIFSDGG